MNNYEKIIANTTRLPGHRITLRKFTMDDAADVLEYGSDFNTLRYLTWAGVTDINEAREIIRRCYLRHPSVYAIELNRIQKCIGYIDLNLIKDHEKASFGYVINSNFWNQGYATEALNIILYYCFRMLDLNRVEATHLLGNGGSGKVMIKCGMIREGFGIEEIKCKGSFQNVIHYGITKNRWRSL